MRIEVRRARAGDGEAIARIHADMADHYAELAPEHFRRPALNGYAAVVDAELAEVKATELELVAEVDGQVVASLYALLIAPVDGAERAIAADLSSTRLRIEYLATAAGHRRSGAGSALVEAAEAWGREQGATVAETTTYHRSPLSVPFWTQRAGYEERSINLRKPL